MSDQVGNYVSDNPLQLGKYVSADSQTQPSTTLYYTYDALGRKTGIYDGDSISAPQLASYTYDTVGVADSMGQLVSATEYDAAGDAYSTAYGGFNAFGEPTSETITIPANEGDLAGQYKYTYGYTSIRGLNSGDIYPASPDGAVLPQETDLHSFVGPLEMPSGLTGSAGGSAIYVGSTSYDGLGRVATENLGSGSGTTATIADTYWDHSGLPESSTLRNAGNQPIDAIGYTYDDTENITQQTDTRNGTTTETQCYTYNGLDRLTQAWTATDNCAADPTTNGGATVGDPLPGSAYWTSWAFNTLGDRTQQDDHSLTGGDDALTDSTFNPAQPDTLTATTTTLDGTPTGSAGYTYDAAGNTITRTTGTDTQTLTWNDQGQLATTTTSAGTSTYLYDAGGNLLIRKDPGNTTTLYLPGQQLVWTTTTHTITGTRFISLPGGGEAVRTGSSTNYSYEFTDQHGSATLTLDHTLQTPTWRQFTPYGAPRGTPPGNWPDTNGFLGDPTDIPNGLTSIGAREYDPATGRFESLDPTLEPTDPNQLGGYTYAGDNPVTHADPTGTRIAANCGVDCGGGSGSSPGTSGGGSTPGSSSGMYIYISSTEYVHILPGGTTIDYRDVDAAGANAYVNGFRVGPDQVHGMSVEQFAQLVDTDTASLEADGMPRDAARIVSLEDVCDQAAANKCDYNFYSTIETVAGAYAADKEGCHAKCQEENDLIPLGIMILLSDGLASIGKDDDEMYTEDSLGGGVYDYNTCYASFAPDTSVLLADGKTKPIGEIRIGDEVASTDPTTGVTKAEPVTALHDNLDTDLTELEIDGGFIETTAGHPFWDVTLQQWTPAGNLRPGDKVRQFNGDTAVVNAVLNTAGEADRKNLTVEQFHTYYVVVGAEPVLVHNAACEGIVSSEQSVDENLAGLSGLQDGDGLSGVYDPQSGVLEARLSNGPNALVNQAGGHGTINNQVFGGSTSTVGFVAIVKDGGLEIRWNSGSVNGRNFGSNAAPEQYREAIMNELTEITGLDVWSS